MSLEHYKILSLGQELTWPGPFDCTAGLSLFFYIPVSAFLVRLDHMMFKTSVRAVPMPDSECISQLY